jgi:hypothetical protein
VCLAPLYMCHLSRINPDVCRFSLCARRALALIHAARLFLTVISSAMWEAHTSLVCLSTEPSQNVVLILVNKHSRSSTSLSYHRLVRYISLQTTLQSTIIPIQWLDLKETAVPKNIAVPVFLWTATAQSQLYCRASAAVHPHSIRYMSSRAVAR